VGLVRATEVPLTKAAGSGMTWPDDGHGHGQKQLVIRLIKKKDNDPKQIKTWRPISLMNVDTKLISRALAERLTKFLPSVISREQLGFVKGRHITEGNRLIDYLIEYYKKNELDGIITAIDFEKAFDSISHQEEVLEELNFPRHKPLQDAIQKPRVLRNKQLNFDTILPSREKLQTR